jgi:DNA-binding CsgD family transcriptional regulator
MLAGGDPGVAESSTHEALELSLERGEEGGVADALDILAAVAVATGAHLDAARMLGASDAVREELWWTRGVYEQAAVDELVAIITNAEGAAAYEAARAEGRAMTRDEAIAFVQRGRGKRGRPTWGWASLTPTETDVVRLVAEGLRNRDIAEKLLMSPATVKTHLTHVFAKLGVKTRTELAAQAAQRSSG